MARSGRSYSGGMIPPRESSSDHLRVDGDPEPQLSGIKSLNLLSTSNLFDSQPRASYVLILKTNVRRYGRCFAFLAEVDRDSVTFAAAEAAPLASVVHRFAIL